ncbi:MAG TPA: alpha/beta hydrolase [Pseudonocardia sp.]|uniref:alpha/beta fold hydrolase n=1 Tax=Pseudonocardia sp. TaxID=60912 RepID=UPI002BE29B9E|nr:alpha/beta hydrolase [Pseudonocardia sp.]HTF47197.1 alpha/beta hydrolase [Pseudonocardia sp.]
MTAQDVEYRDIAGMRTAVRERGTGDPVIFVHGNPDSADEWAPFLDRAEQLGRVIAPDMPGFGRSVRPRLVDFAVLKMWFRALVDDLGVDRYRLVVHDWGAVALAAAALRPEQLEKLVVIDAIPLSAAYRWHWLARVWRVPVLGELAVFGMNRATLKQVSRLSSPRPGPMDDAFLDEATRYLNAGMRRAILGLYRSADPGVLQAAGVALEEVRCPALVIWGEGDPYLGTDEAYRYGAALTNSTVEVVPGVGHWCFREDRAVVDRVIKFLGAG